MKNDYYKIDVDNIRFLAFIGLLCDADENEMTLAEIWEKTKSLYYYSHPDFTEMTVNMGAMKRDIKMARKHGYLTMIGSRSSTRYVKTDLLKNRPMVGL